MEEVKIDRINALAKKAKEEGLSEQEKEAHAALRKEYVAAIKENFRATLSQIKFEDEDAKNS